MKKLKFTLKNKSICFAEIKTGEINLDGVQKVEIVDIKKYVVLYFSNIIITPVEMSICDDSNLYDYISKGLKMNYRVQIQIKTEL